MNNIGYQWSWVNHDKCYVDPLTGDHTNKIESSWFAVKRQLPRGGRYNLKRCQIYILFNLQIVRFELVWCALAKLLKRVGRGARLATVQMDLGTFVSTSKFEVS